MQEQNMGLQVVKNCIAGAPLAEGDKTCWCYIF
jgi:hypothetical protein